MKKSHQVLILVLGGVAGLALIIHQAVGVFGEATGHFDQVFDHQHLNTTVALLELHRTRTGSYPERLVDIEFTGAWDPIHANAVKFCPTADHTKYFLEISRGWLGKPSMEVPEMFWK